MSIDIDKWLTGLRLPASLEHYPREFKALHDQKLWHQLTVAVEAFAQEPQALPFIATLYRDFVSQWQARMSPLSLSRLAVKAAYQVPVDEAIRLLEHVQSKYQGERKGAECQAVCILAAMECAHFYIAAGQVDKAKAVAAECQVLLDRLLGVDPSICAVFYRVSAELFKAAADYTRYYQASLAYLACRADRPCVERAHDTIVAALLSDQVYNFGELVLQTDFLRVLDGTEHGYLVDLLHSFNAGDFHGAARVAAKVHQHALLKDHSAFLDAKLRLMALADGLFARLRVSRQVRLAEVAEMCKCPIESVELVLLEAFALGIVKGSINQVRQELTVDWVQPRVLSERQISELKDSFTAWRSRVQSTLSFIDAQVTVM